MTWKEGLKRVAPPDFKPDQILEKYASLAEGRDRYRPVPYFEETVEAASCEVDNSQQIVYLGSLAVEYAMAHRDPVLPELYDIGAKEGVDELGLIKNAVDSLPFEVVPRSGAATIHGAILFERGLLDPNLSLEHRTMRTARLNELRALYGDTALSKPLKRIACAEYIQTWISLMIKGTADNQVNRLHGLTSSPADFFKRLYRGDEHQVGFARYAGCYEAFSESLGELYAKEFGDNKPEASALLGCALFMGYQQSNSAWTLAKVREYKLQAMHLIDEHRLDDSRAYLRHLWTQNSQVFSTISTYTLWGREVPKPPDIRSIRADKREEYRMAVLNSRTSPTYCREVLGLTPKEVDQQAQACAGMVVGMVKGMDPAKGVDYDIGHFERYIHPGGVHKWTGTAFKVARDSRARLESVGLPRMGNATLLAMLDLGRLVVLEKDISPADLIYANHAELIRRLDAARRALGETEASDTQ